MTRGTIYIAILVLFAAGTAAGQDLPLFNQKLSNSFLYNPSIAGRGLGSITLSNKTFWNGVPGAPKAYLISGHTPFGVGKYGVGFNLITEKVAAQQVMYGNGAFAYHLGINDESTLSFGVSAEYASIRTNLSLVDVVDATDPMINQDNRSSVDFSVGVSYRNRLLDLGVSTNRLSTALGIADFKSQISQFYTGYVSFKLPLTNYHLLEPSIIYRKLSTESDQWEASLYYSYRKGIILGVNYRSGGIISPVVALHFNERLLIGYSFEMFGTGLQKEIGGTNEITLRLDFMQESYYKNLKNSQEIMRKSLTYRRKTLTYSRIKGKSMSASNPKYNKKVRRNYIKSPSFRMNSSNKLATRKLNSSYRLGRKNASGNIRLKASNRRKISYRKYSKQIKRIR